MTFYVKYNKKNFHLERGLESWKWWKLTFTGKKKKRNLHLINYGDVQCTWIHLLPCLCRLKWHCQRKGSLYLLKCTDTFRATSTSGHNPPPSFLIWREPRFILPSVTVRHPAFLTYQEAEWQVMTHGPAFWFVRKPNCTTAGKCSNREAGGQGMNAHPDWLGSQTHTTSGCRYWVLIQKYWNSNSICYRCLPIKTDFIGTNTVPS